MSIATTVDAANDFAERAATWLATPLLFAFRWYVAWQFLKSGWLKVSDWDSTLYLFQEEYHVPLLPPGWPRWLERRANSSSLHCW